MKNIFVILIAGFFAGGCATTPIPDVTTHYDPITGYRTDLIPENLLETQQPSRELLWLNASRVFRNWADFDYFLEVHYEALPEPGWLHIKPGKSLVVTADGQELQFDGRGSLNTRRTRRGNVSEDAIYRVEPAQLRAIARAKKVRVRVVGENGVVEREFGPVNFERFRKFVERYASGGG